MLDNIYVLNSIYHSNHLFIETATRCWFQWTFQPKQRFHVSVILGWPNVHITLPSKYKSLWLQK